MIFERTPTELSIFMAVSRQSLNYSEDRDVFFSYSEKT